MVKIKNNHIIMTVGDTARIPIQLKCKDKETGEMVDYIPGEFDIIRFTVREDPEDEEALLEKVIPFPESYFKKNSNEDKEIETFEESEDVEDTDNPSEDEPVEEIPKEEETEETEPLILHIKPQDTKHFPCDENLYYDLQIELKEDPDIEGDVLTLINRGRIKVRPEICRK